MDKDTDDSPIGAEFAQHRLLKSLYRNADLHLSASRKDHSVAKTHNCVTLYFRVPVEENELGVTHLYRPDKIISRKPLSYDEWLKEVLTQVALTESGPRDVFYGWQTHTVKIGFIFTGDLVISIDNDGTHYARFPFNTKEIHKGYSDAEK